MEIFKNQELIGHQPKTKKEMKVLAKKKLTRLSKSPKTLKGIFLDVVSQIYYTKESV